MKRSTVDLHPARTASSRRPFTTTAFAAVACLGLVLAACGGDDDDGGESSATSSTVDIQVSPSVAPVTAPTTTAPPATAPPTTPPPLDLVTKGATLVVANASGVDGAAGRMTDALGAAGFKTGSATNSTESQLETTKVYYDPENADAKAVAESVRLALGGGDIEVLELAVPAPVSDPDALGKATILVALGNDTADKSLDELQGRVAPAEETSDEAGSGESTAEESSGAGTADESTDEGSADE